MALQTTVNANLNFGVIGEIYDNSLLLPDSYILASGTDINTVGNAFTINAADPSGVSMGGTGVFGGLLINPKSYPNTSSDLTVGVNVNDGIDGVFMKEGRAVVNVGGAATVGDSVYFDQTTGALGIGTAGAGQTQIVGAQVVLFDIGADGKGVVELNNQK